jgi:3'(2'), 5'-bisphosphate nucleotidase
VAKLPLGVDINNLIDNLRIFSWEAAEILIYYSNIIQDSTEKSRFIQNKNYDDPVTLADIKVNELIVNKIRKSYRNVSWDILSEEDIKTETNTFIRTSEWCWVLDPLDGTKDFIQGTGNYAMHLALNYKQKPLIGVVLIPERNELWISNGEKLWRERRDGSKIEKYLSSRKTINEMTLVTSKNHSNNTLKRLIEKLNFKDVIVMGSIGCKIASILRGESDIYICLSLPGRSSPKDWDFAAPEALLKAAGGTITDLNNNELTYGKSNFEQGGILVATNNKLTHQSICSEINCIIKKFDLFTLDS